MSEPLGERVHGRGYSRDELTPEERAVNRHRNSILDDEFKSPEELVLSVDPKVLAKHIGVGALSALSLFWRDNKPVIAGAVAVIGALNWQKVATWATLIAEVMK